MAFTEFVQFFSLLIHPARKITRRGCWQNSLEPIPADATKLFIRNNNPDMEGMLEVTHVE